MTRPALLYLEAKKNVLDQTQIFGSVNSYNLSISQKQKYKNSITLGGVDVLFCFK